MTNVMKSVAVALLGFSLGFTPKMARAQSPCCDENGIERIEYRCVGNNCNTLVWISNCPPCAEGDQCISGMPEQTTCCSGTLSTYTYTGACSEIEHVARKLWNRSVVEKLAYLRNCSGGVSIVRLTTAEGSRDGY